MNPHPLFLTFSGTGFYQFLLRRERERFGAALEGFVPALRKEGFTVIPNVTWNQVGALEVARKQLQASIIGPIKWPAMYEELEYSPSAGVLLWGPPGCGKTLIAQAVANDAKASFILINGPELLNKYVTLLQTMHRVL
ncbi:hypothetical protein E4U13_004656 [Claviceps humidiphila]|uniref:ATPase AAA-type core domain-containing protein n=1 Tax=Claviceps humidiphila TaxID=1294629 RepID=A0A9P7Q6A4_9HYPO|nr:hypothetical protein E4U13_004656 [Claviceps humidiphila]